MQNGNKGLKRTCQSCGTRFYDLGRTPILCPSCGATHDPCPPQKPARPAPKPVAKAETPATDVEKNLQPDNDNETDNALVSDSLDLEDGDDDVSEVIGNMVDGKPKKE